MIAIRPSTREDHDAVMRLYRRVAAISGGIARAPDEIDAAYIAKFLSAAAASGAGFVAIEEGRVVGELHCYALGPKIFAHVLGELTVAVDPDWQGRGVGRALFTALLDHVRAKRADITRVELVTQEGNLAGRRLYAAMGFKEEGRMAGRVRTPRGIEADIPMAWMRDS